MFAVTLIQEPNCTLQTIMYMRVPLWIPILQGFGFCIGSMKKLNACT